MSLSALTGMMDLTAVTGCDDGASDSVPALRRVSSNALTVA